MTENHFQDYLLKEGFENPGFGFWCGTSKYDSFYINIDSMVYVPSRPGVQYARPIGDCIITEKEFKVIWKIYKKRKALISKVPN